MSDNICNLKMASSLYREPVIQPVDGATLKQISDNLGLEIPDEEIQEYAEAINLSIKGAAVLHQLPEDKPQVLYPRTPGIRPLPEDNKFNAWYIKTDIKGETTGLLAGKRVVIKDNVAVAGVPMMNGSRLLEGHVPDYDATVVTRILKEGGIIAGKSTCENLCSTGNSFSSATGPVLNPHDPTRSAGGSSSGSAALVAAGEVDMAIGSDTAGSIQIPAAWCGIVGFKPTFGLVPYTGTTNVYPPFDHLGPMARNVTDCAALLQAIAGQDGFDGRQNVGIKTSDYLGQLEDSVSGIKVGILQEGFANCNENVTQTVRQALDKMKTVGCILDDVSVFEHNLGGVVMGNILTLGYSEILQNAGISIGTGGWHDSQLSERLHLAVKSQSRDMPKAAKRLILEAESFKSNDHFRTFIKAENIVPRIRKAYDDVFSIYDVIAMPTAKQVAPKLPQKQELTFAEYDQECFGLATNTCVANITGHPAISINATASNHQGSLPVGMMIVGHHFEDAMVLRVARALEKLLRGQ